jgi:hypothetical protein
MKESTQILRTIAILVGIFPFFATACSPVTPPSATARRIQQVIENTVNFDHSHSDFDLVLKQYVVNGWVDYRGIQAEPSVFSDYMHSLGSVPSQVFEQWSREQKLAYWINAYNAFTIQAVIERYPIKERSLIGLFYPQNSILQISGIWSRLKFNAGGRSLTLGQIEHDILRKAFDEPRIHFAIVCASRSCPSLRSEAYRFDLLERQLHQETVKFINDPDRGTRWDAARQRLHISKIVTL